MEGNKKEGKKERRKGDHAKKAFGSENGLNIVKEQKKTREKEDASRKKETKGGKIEEEREWAKGEMRE